MFEYLKIEVKTSQKVIVGWNSFPDTYQFDATSASGVRIFEVTSDKCIPANQESSPKFRKGNSLVDTRTPFSYICFLFEDIYFCAQL